MFSFRAGLHVLASFNRLLLGSLKRSHPVGPLTAPIRVVLVGGAGLKGLSEIRSFADGEQWVLKAGRLDSARVRTREPGVFQTRAEMPSCLLKGLHSLRPKLAFPQLLVPPRVAVMVPCVLSTRWSCPSPWRPSHPLSTCLGQAAPQMPGCPPDIPIP